MIIKKERDGNQRIITIFGFIKIKYTRKDKKRTYDPRLITACDIQQDIEALIAKGVSFDHPVGIVIDKRASIGEMCNIYQNVTIGPKAMAESYPRLPRVGKNVKIYAGAAVLGDITIGDNAIIGANAVVLQDVPPNAVMAGVPARQIGTNNITPEADALRQIWTRVESAYLDSFELSHIVAELNSNSICIDCGANVGNIIQIFSNKGATVYAFEPNPTCFSMLKTRFANNANVILSDKGVLDKNSTMKLFKYQFHEQDELFFSQGSSLYNSNEEVSQSEYYEIEVIDLVNFIQQLDKPVDILKLDVEGAEFAILEKLIDSGLYKTIQHILVETHDDTIPEIKDIAARVRKKISDLGIKNIDLTWM